MRCSSDRLVAFMYGRRSGVSTATASRCSSKLTPRRSHRPDPHRTAGVAAPDLSVADPLLQVGGNARAVHDAATARPRRVREHEPAGRRHRRRRRCRDRVQSGPLGGGVRGRRSPRDLTYRLEHIRAYLRSRGDGRSLRICANCRVWMWGYPAIGTVVSGGAGRRDRARTARPHLVTATSSPYGLRPSKASAWRNSRPLSVRPDLLAETVESKCCRRRAPRRTLGVCRLPSRRDCSRRPRAPPRFPVRSVAALCRVETGA